MSKVIAIETREEDSFTYLVVEDEEGYVADEKVLAGFYMSTKNDTAPYFMITCPEKDYKVYEIRFNETVDEKEVKLTAHLLENEYVKSKVLSTYYYKLDKVQK